MNLKLTIEGSASQLAMILANLPVGVAVASPSPAIPAMPAMIGGGDGDDESGAVNLTAPAVDSSGLPWDERIHAKTKAMTDNNTWRKRRGVGAATVAAIEAQLRASSPIAAVAVPVVAPVAMPPVAMQPLAPPPVPVAPVAAPAPMVMPAPEPTYTPPPMPEAAAPVPMAMPVPEQAPTPPPAADAIDFAQFMQHLSEQMGKRDAAGAPLVHADYLAAITNEISTAFAPQGVQPLSAITDIAANPPLITYAVQLMQRDGRW